MQERSRTQRQVRMSSNYRQHYLLSSSQATAAATAQQCRPATTSNRLSSQPDQRRDLELRQAMAECHLSGLPEPAGEPQSGRPSDGLGPARYPSDSNYIRPTSSSSSSYSANVETNQKQSNRRLHNNFVDPNDWQLQQVAEPVRQSDGQYSTRRDLSVPPTSTTATSSLRRQQQQTQILPANININNNHLEMAAAKQQERRQLHADFGPTTSGRHPMKEFVDLGDYRRSQQTSNGGQNNNNNNNMRREEPTMSDQDEYASQLRRTSQRHHNNHHHHNQQDLRSNQSTLNYNQANQANQTGRQEQPRSSPAARQTTSLHVNFNRSSQNCNGNQQEAAGEGDNNHHDDDDDDGHTGSTRKKKYLTAKYGQQQMNLIKKRLKIEMWLYEQLQELAKLTNSEVSRTQEARIVCLITTNMTCLPIDGRRSN